MPRFVRENKYSNIGASSCLDSVSPCLSVVSLALGTSIAHSISLVAFVSAELQKREIRLNWNRHKPWQTKSIAIEFLSDLVFFFFFSSFHYYSTEFSISLPPVRSAAPATIDDSKKEKKKKKKKNWNTGEKNTLDNFLFGAFHYWNMNHCLAAVL